MKKIIFISMFMGCVLSGATIAQSDYKTSLGVRLGAANGLTVKHFTSDVTSLEGILSTRWRGFIVTGLYQINQDIFNDPQFNFYYGGGAHLGFWDGVHSESRGPWDSYHDDYADGYVAIGIDGVVGLEYTISEVPFCFALDWKPAFNLFQNTGFWFEHFGLSVRYVFP